MTKTKGKKQTPNGIVHVHCTIEGVSPLLMNQFTIEAQARADSGTSMSIAGDAGTPREVAEPKIYRCKKGFPCLPGPNIFAALIDAGKFHKVGKSKVTTLRSSLVPAAVSVTNLTCPVTNNGEAQSKTKWEVDSRPIVNPATKGRRPCHRPRFDEWRVPFDLEVDTKLFTVKFLRQLIDDAGSRIGLGDFRPDRKGPFGKFKVVEWEVDG